jgi:LETM1-like protein
MLSIAHRSGTFRSNRIRSFFNEKSGSLSDSRKFAIVANDFSVNSPTYTPAKKSTPSFQYSSLLEVSESEKNSTSFDDIRNQFLRNGSMFPSKIESGLKSVAVWSEKSSGNITWKEARREYVVKTTLPTGLDVDIPLFFALRTFSYHHLPLTIKKVPKQLSSIPILRNQKSANFLSTIATNTALPGYDQYSRFVTRDFSQRVTPNQKLETTDIPIPVSSLPVLSNPLETLKKSTPKSLIRKGVDMTVTLFRTIISFLLKMPGNTYYYITHSKERQEAIDGLRKAVKHEIHHYWNGTKLLWADIKTAQNLLNKTLQGSSLTRRERRQLLRTVSDLFRLIPFSMFVIIPFMEVALPFALRLFPNLLPSTYQDSLKAEESMKRELKTRIAMAQFFQE